MTNFIICHVWPTVLALSIMGAAYNPHGFRYSPPCKETETPNLMVYKEHYFTMPPEVKDSIWAAFTYEDSLLLESVIGKPNEPKTITICPKGCDYKTIEEAYNKEKE